MCIPLTSSGQITLNSIQHRGLCGCDHMLVGFTTTCAINAYQRLSCEFEPCSWQGVLDTTLCDKVCQWQVGGFLNK